MPPKCPFCAVEVNLPSFERQLTTEQLGTYMSYMLMAQLPEGEVMISCPFAGCPYFETRQLGEGGSLAEINFFHCQHWACRKVSCGLCKKECKPCDDEEDDDDEIGPEQRGMMEHFVCAERELEFGAQRISFEKAIEASTRVPCPVCGQAGMKDDACTHMTCDNCATVWCYVCGLDTASDACSKAKNRDMAAEYAHNVNWHTQPGRCPMYLGEISQVDQSYSEDDNAAMLTLHRQRALRCLRCAQPQGNPASILQEYCNHPASSQTQPARSAEYDKIGRVGYRRLVEAFPTLGQASGFSEQEILSVEADTPLFTRGNNEDFEEDEEEEEEE